MPTRSARLPENQGRKSAYVARNRLAIIKAAQQVLATEGVAAVIEVFSQAAQVSTSTIYKHFANKDALVIEAFAAMFHEWEAWVDSLPHDPDDPLEELVMPMRLLLRLRLTHPLAATMFAKNLADASKLLPRTEVGLLIHVAELRANGTLNFDNPDMRIRMISSCLASSLSNQLLNPKASEADADTAVRLMLKLLEVEDSEAHRVTSVPLPNLGTVT